MGVREQGEAVGRRDRQGRRELPGLRRASAGAGDPLAGAHQGRRGARERRPGQARPGLAESIAGAADRVGAGEYDDQFPIDVFQTGSGTSSNTNANEVIANLAGDEAHPNDHVNMGQSSNDVFPSAVHLAALDEATNDLLPALEQLEASFAQGERVQGHRQVRAHAPDGRGPGDARPGVRRLRRADAAGPERVRNALPQVAQIPLGGTATGTGLNTHPQFAEKVRALLSAHSGLEISAPEDPFEAQGNRDALVELSGALKVVAVSLTKIAQDLALMGSGPRAGIGELFLPELQKGSSIMPGKVNPVIPEVVMQVGAQVIGNDTAITIAGTQGNFELNVRIPLMARNLLQSIHLLTSASKLFAEKCVNGIEANLAGTKRSAEGTLAVATALNPYIGYDKAAEIVRRRRSRARRCARSHSPKASTRRRSMRHSTRRKIAEGSAAEGASWPSIRVGPSRQVRGSASWVKLKRIRAAHAGSPAARCR